MKSFSPAASTAALNQNRGEHKRVPSPARNTYGAAVFVGLKCSQRDDCSVVQTADADRDLITAILRQAPNVAQGM